MNFIGNKELSSSIYKISGSYNGIAELYKTKVWLEIDIESNDFIILHLGKWRSSRF